MASNLPHSSIFQQNNASLPHLPLRPPSSSSSQQDRRPSLVAGYPKVRTISFSHPPAKYTFVARHSLYSCPAQSTTSLASVPGILKRDRAESSFEQAVEEAERNSSRHSSVSSRSEWLHSTSVAWGAQKSFNRSSISLHHYPEPLCPPTPPFQYSDSASISSNSSDSSPGELLTPAEVVAEMDMRGDHGPERKGGDLSGKAEVKRGSLLGDAFELGRPISPPDSTSSGSAQQHRFGGLFGDATGGVEAPASMLSPAASLPQAPTFDSPSRFASNKQSFPSPIQAGFRTPVSRRTERPVSVVSPNPRIARTLTFGQEEKVVAGSSGSNEGASSSAAQTPTDESQGFAVSSEQSQAMTRRPVPAAFVPINFGPESPMAHTRDLARPQSAHAAPVAAGPSGQSGHGTPVRTPPSHASVSTHLRHNDSPTLPRAFGPDRKHAASPHLIDLERYAGVINMGEGLAGGPQRDTRGKKIDLKKWGKSDPLSGRRGEEKEEKKLGGFKHRFSQSMADLFGSSKGTDNEEVQPQKDQRRRSSMQALLRMKPSRSYSADYNTLHTRADTGSTSRLRNTRLPDSAQTSDSWAAPPEVPARTTSHINSAFLERQKRLALENSSAIPYSPSMPVLSDSLRSSRMHGDARVTAWLSATQLSSPEAQPEGFDGRSKRQLGQLRSVSFQGIPDYRDKPLPPLALASPDLSASQTTTATTTSAVLTPRSSVRTAPQSISQIEQAEAPSGESEKSRKRSIPGWARLFGKQRASDADPVSTSPESNSRPSTPDWGFRSPSVPGERSELRASSSLKNLLKLNLSREKLGAAESGPPTFSRRSSGDWRRLLQGQAETTPVRQEDAEFFASVITGSGPSASPATSTPSQFSSTSDARPPTPQVMSFEPSSLAEGVVLGPIMEQSLPTLVEAVEEEETQPKVTRESRGKRQSPTYKSQATQTDGHCPHCSPAYIDYSGSIPEFTPTPTGRKVSVQTIKQIRHSVGSLDASDISSVEDDVHIQTIVSSPVHSLPSRLPGTPGAGHQSILFQGSPTDSRSRTSLMSIEGFPVNLQFPLPPGRSD